MAKKKAKLTKSEKRVLTGVYIMWTLYVIGILLNLIISVQGTVATIFNIASIVGYTLGLLGGLGILDQFNAIAMDMDNSSIYLERYVPILPVFMARFIQLGAVIALGEFSIIKYVSLFTWDIIYIVFLLIDKNKYKYVIRRK